MTAEQVFLAEKFAPCPRCRCFSLEIVKVGRGKTREKSARTWFTCTNCDYRFSARIAREGESIKTVSIRDRAFVIKYLVLAVLITAALIFLALQVSNWLSSSSSRRAANKTKQSEVIKIEQQKSARAARPVKVRKKKTVAVTQQKKITPVTPQTVPTAGKSSAIQEKKVPAREKSLDMELTPRQPSSKPQTIPQETAIKPTSTRVFDLSYMKVRSSYPDSAGPTHRWFFKKLTVTVKRSSEQRVYIAGDQKGRSPWCVDDEIRINGQRIKGFSEEITEIGVIPRAAKVPPHDITALVPSGVEVSLDIRLVDYGIFWGNTAIYIVVK